MKRKKVIGVSLLAMALMLVSQVSATTLETMLPSSSLYDGYTYYGETVTNTDGTSSYMQGRIDFAVYDTKSGNEWEAAGYTNPGNGQYVYAYQIFNDYNGYSELAVQAFSILGLNDAEISVFAGSVGTEQDPAGGQDASDTTSDSTSVTWNFSYTNLDNDYTIAVGDHSYFLIFSSNSSWVAGDYSLEAYNSDLPVADVDSSTNFTPAPEPVTVALLGLGSLIAFAKGRRK
ncbi:MAG TPA: PEP-CTERM sorting domain-containing protein [Sedimentisphaerales bacterium]|nr:PEP-CTERM sorting domain-containing protein [Sedimentisphaerales bacterium]